LAGNSPHEYHAGFFAAAELKEGQKYALFLKNVIILLS
jgi:hypothetical protein